MKTIIVPLDESAYSERSIGLGVAFAQAYGATLALVHVLEEPLAFDLLPGLITPDRFAAEAYLRRLAEGLPPEIEVSIQVLRGSPVETLLRLSEDAPESMLVLSTHGRGGLRRLMLGSVADKILRDALVPVALVRGPATPMPQRLQTVLVPLDTSAFSETAMPVAVDLARRSGASLGLVHVCQPFWVSPYAASMPELGYVNDTRVSEIERETLANGRYYLDRLASDIRAEGIRTVWEVRFGNPASEILRAAETTEADLIVMATHDRTGLRRLALGSITNDVLQHGTTPILAIPPHVVEHQRLEAAGLRSSI